MVKKGNILENTVIVTSYLSDLSRNGGQDVSTLLIAGVRHFVCARISTLTAQHHPRKKKNETFGVFILIGLTKRTPLDYANVSF